jgi:hypothetical protein
MILQNDTLSDLKAYARRTYYLNNNVPVLVILISEEEHKILRNTYNEIVQANYENGAILKDVSKEEDVPHYSEEFFSKCCQYL